MPAIAAAIADAAADQPVPALVARVQRRLAVLEPATAALARVLALRLDIGDDVLAGAAGLDCRVARTGHAYAARRGTARPGWRAHDSRRGHGAALGVAGRRAAPPPRRGRPRPRLRGRRRSRRRDPVASLPRVHPRRRRGLPRRRRPTTLRRPDGRCLVVRRRGRRWRRPHLDRGGPGRGGGAARAGVRSGAGGSGRARPAGWLWSRARSPRTRAERPRGRPPCQRRRPRADARRAVAHGHRPARRRPRRGRNPIRRARAAPARRGGVGGVRSGRRGPAA